MNYCVFCKQNIIVVRNAVSRDNDLANEKLAEAKRLHLEELEQLKRDHVAELELVKHDTEQRLQTLLSDKQVLVRCYEAKELSQWLCCHGNHRTFS